MDRLQHAVGDPGGTLADAPHEGGIPRRVDLDHLRPGGYLDPIMRLRSQTPPSGAVNVVPSMRATISPAATDWPMAGRAGLTAER